MVVLIYIFTTIFVDRVLLLLMTPINNMEFFYSPVKISYFLQNKADIENNKILGPIKVSFHKFNKVAVTRSSIKRTGDSGLSSSRESIFHHIIQIGLFFTDTSKAFSLTRFI